ncbi:methionyl-tRNA formyltransferase [soil metagenome]
MSLRIIFMGTPEFAVPSLDRLVKAGYTIAAVVTAPDKHAGRGMHLTQSAVKKYAAEKELPVLQPDKLKSPEFIDALKALKADLQIVVAFRMLPEVVWNMPPMGTVNLHASLLPQYRGAAPINRAIINGEKFTGVTTFKLKHEIDTGNILLQQKIEIGEKETAGELHDRMKEIGAGLLLKTVNGLAENSLEDLPQSEVNIQQPITSNKQQETSNKELKHAPKIFTETCKIDWSNTTDDVYNLIRGLSPYPAAFTMLNGKTLKIYRADKETGSSISEDIETDKKTYFKFRCADGLISVKELQLEGKKRMRVEEFLRGYHF